MLTMALVCVAPRVLSGLRIPREGDAELRSGQFFPGHAAIMTGSAGPRQSIAPPEICR